MLSRCKILKSVLQLTSSRAISTSQTHHLKEIITVEKDKLTVVEGRYVTSPREPYLVKPTVTEEKKPCPLCSLGIDVKHTDVLILHQFVRSDGCMLPRRITGLCCKQQRRVGTMVSMAQKAGILYPRGSKSDPAKRPRYKKFNTYYDESTIDRTYKRCAN